MFVLKGLLFALFDTLNTTKWWQSNTSQGNEKLLFTAFICKPCLMILFQGLVLDATNSTTFGNNTLAVGKIWVAGKDSWK